MQYVMCDVWCDVPDLICVGDRKFLIWAGSVLSYGIPKLTPNGCHMYTKTCKTFKGVLSGQ